MTDKTTRRTWLQRTGMLGAAAGLGAVGLSSLLAACKKGGGSGSSKAAGGGAGKCNDLTGVSPAQKAVRSGLKYVERGNNLSKVCKLCSLYKKPAGGAACGTCTLFKGPVAELGYCTGFKPKAT